MTRAEGRRLYGHGDPETEEGGPDPTEDPILYLGDWNLIEEIGFAPMDAGTLAESRRQGPGSPVHNVAMRPGQARETLAGMG